MVYIEFRQVGVARQRSEQQQYFVAAKVKVQNQSNGWFYWKIPNEEVEVRCKTESSNLTPSIG
jgi:hypothetical protein